MSMRLHHPEDLEQAISDYELGERLRSEPRWLGAAHARRMGGAGIRRGIRGPSGGGGGPSYLLDFNAATFTRVGEAAAEDPRIGWPWYDLTTPWPGTDVPRIQVDGAILIEGARTNVVTDSADFSTWTTSNATVTLDQVDAPDGSSSTADLIEGAGGGSPKEITLASGLSSGDVTFSVWVRKATYTGNVTVLLDDGTSSPTTTIALTDAWQRISVSLASVAGATTAAIQVPTGAADVYVWGAQIEAAAFASSDIRTSGGTGTRGVDSCTFPTASLPAGALSAMESGTWSVEVYLPMSSAELAADGSALQLLHMGTAVDWNALTITSGGVLTLRADVSTGPAELTLTWDAGTTLTITVDFPGSELSVSGALTGDGSDATNGNDWSNYTSNNLYVGRAALSGAGHSVVIGQPVAA